MPLSDWAWAARLAGAMGAVGVVLLTQLATSVRAASMERALSATPSIPVGSVP